MDFSIVNTTYALSKDLDTFIFNVNKTIVNPLIVLLFALALAFFLYGVFEFIAYQNNEEKKTKSKSHMLWGIIGITIMMGVWTIIKIITNTLNITKVDPATNTVNLKDYDASYPKLK